MAIYTTQRTQSYSLAYGAGAARQLISDTVSVAMTTAMLDNANDEVELLWVPAGAVFDSAVLSATDMDSGTALLFDVGDDAAEPRIFSSSNIGQAGGITAAFDIAAHGYKWTAATKIKAYIKTAAGTPVAGTLKFTMRYFVDAGFVAANAVVS
jgi:hypothetical protein